MLQNYDLLREGGLYITASSLHCFQDFWSSFSITLLNFTIWRWLLQYFVNRPIWPNPILYATFRRGDLSRSVRPRAAWGTGVYPSQQNLDIKMRCLQLRRLWRRWLHTRQSGLFSKSSIQRSERIGKDLNIFSNRVNITPT